MGWYKREIEKSIVLAGYVYEDSIDPQLRQLYQRVSALVPNHPEATKILDRINRGLGSWNKNRLSPDAKLRNDGLANAQDAFRRALAFLNSAQALPPNDPLPAYLQQTQQSQSWAGFGEDKQALAQRVTLVDGTPFNKGKPGPAQWIAINGVRLHPEDLGIKKITKNPFAAQVQLLMGEDMVYKDTIKEQFIYVRGTKEAWEKFVDNANWLFKNAEVLRGYKFPQPLPSEAQFNPAYQAAAKQQRKDKPFTASIIQSSVDAGGARGIQGIRLAFSPDDPDYRRDFPLFRDFIFDSAGFNPTKTRFYWDQGVCELYDYKPKDVRSAENLYRVANKLQQMGYANTGQLRGLVQQLTGLKSQEAYSRFSEEKRNKARSVATTVSALNANVYEGGPRLASRFASIKAELGITEGQPLTDEQHEQIIAKAYAGNAKVDPATGQVVGPWGPNNWVGPFGPAVNQYQRKAQTEGMRFVAGRVSSILADEPGSGKTAQMIVGADSVREDGQKILVVTPNILLRENWIGPDAKGPMYFCGHDRKQIAVVKSAQEVEKAVADPNVVWVIVRESDIKLRGEKTQLLCRAIAAHAAQGKFGALAIDEIQKFKNMDSNSFDKLQTAISGYHIPHRIGMTGTPADNTPKDMWVQLSILRHRVLYEDKGTENLVNTQSAEGFAQQYLGGPALSESVTLSPEERRLPEEKQEELKQQRWTEKGLQVLAWVSQLDDKRKQSTLDLFSNTFLRREKEDINPDLRKVAPKTETTLDVPTDPAIAGMSKQGKGWNVQLMKQTAMAKTSATAQRAAQILQSDPNAKIFIGTQFIDAANAIAQQINAQLGEGVASAVTGQIKDEDARAEIAATFRKGGTILRCVVYTSDLGAVGLNFNNAQTCIMNDLDWNPSINEQMVMRVDRIDTKHPINIEYATMGGSYDQEMQSRIAKKRAINHAMTSMMRAARHQPNGPEKVKLANEFVKQAIDNIILDAGLSKERLKWFEDNLDKAFAGQPIETWQDLEAREERERSRHPIDVHMPDFLQETPRNNKEMREQVQSQKEWRSQMLDEIQKRYGVPAESLPPEVIEEFFIERERRRLERIRQIQLDRDEVTAMVDNLQRKSFGA